MGRREFNPAWCSVSWERMSRESARDRRRQRREASAPPRTVAGLGSAVWSTDRFGSGRSVKLDALVLTR